MSNSERLISRREWIKGIPLILAGMSHQAYAGVPSPRWVVWFSESTGVQQTIINELRQRLSGSVHVEFRSLQPTQITSVGDGLAGQVVLGTRTLREWVALKPSMPAPLLNTPVMSALVPRAAETPLAAELPVGSSGIWLDQPPERFTALIAAAFPRRNRVGVLLGPAHGAWLPGLEAAARADALSLVLSPVLSDARSLFPALTAVLSESDLLLAQPDGLLFNNDTLQNVLIATYRQRVPMVTFSEPHVRAGATLGVFTSPTDVAAQVAEAIAGWSAARRWPGRAFAAIGRVAVNTQVARSLGIDLPSVEALEAALQRRQP